MFSGTVPAAVNGEVESIKKKFGNTFPDIEIASALKINNMDAEQSTEFLREIEPFVEVKRKGRGRNKKMVPENHVQQQQEAVAQVYPLAPLSHQPEPFVEVKRKGRGRNKKMVPENQVQQQQEAVAQMHPLAHLSHQPGDNVAIDIPQTEDSCSTSPAPAPAPTPSDMPSSPGSAASLPPSPPGPPPPPAAPQLSLIQDHYWTVIDKDELVQFLNLSSS